jgi:hypothetical protein
MEDPLLKRSLMCAICLVIQAHSTDFYPYQPPTSRTRQLGTSLIEQSNNQESGRIHAAWQRLRHASNKLRSGRSFVTKPYISQLAQESIRLLRLILHSPYAYLQGSSSAEVSPEGPTNIKPRQRTRERSSIWSLAGIWTLDVIETSSIEQCPSIHLSLRSCCMV